MARPTDYNEDLAERICEHIAGGNSLRSFCRLPDTPDLSTVCRWIVRHEEFRKQYVYARESAGYAHADSILDVVDQIASGEMEPNAARVMMDGLKWAAERMAPKAHSPKQALEHSGPNGDPIKTESKVEWTIQPVKPINEADS